MTIMRDTAMKAAQSADPQGWARATQVQREEMTSLMLASLQSQEAEIATTMGNPPLTGDYLGDAGALNQQRMAATELVTSSLTERLWADAPEAGQRFWTWWVADHPGEEPVLEELLTRWEHYFPMLEEMHLSPTSFERPIYWEEFTVENPDDEEEINDRKTELLELVNHLLTKEAVNQLRMWATDNGEPDNTMTLSRVKRAMEKIHEHEPLARLAFSTPALIKRQLQAFTEWWEWEEMSDWPLPAWVAQWKAELT